jgi:hypothetical protein
VQVEAAVVGEGVEEVLEELGRHLAHALGAEPRAVAQVPAAGEVDHRARERLVERHVGVAEAGDALLVAERLAERVAEDDAHVLHRVMGVDLQVAGGGHLEVEAGVGAERVQHVVEEPEAGRDLAAAAALEHERERDLRLAGPALHARLAHVGGGDHGDSFMAAEKASSMRSFSGPVPMEMRRQRASRG